MLRNGVSKRNCIFICLSTLALLVPPVAFTPRSARGDGGATFKGTFTVQAELLTTITTCAPGDANCSACLNSSGVDVEAQSVGETTLGPLFFEILKCFNPAGGSFGTYAGTFTMTTPDGKDSIAGTYSGQNDNAGDAYGFGPFSGKWTVTGGIGKFNRTQGSASFTAVAGPFTAGPSPNTFVLMAFYSFQGQLALAED